MHFDKKAKAQHEYYFIDTCELELLMAGALMKEWYGLSPRSDRDRQPLTEEEIHRILAGLYQKGYVTWEGETIKVKEPVSSLIRILKHAESCMKIVRNRETSPLLLAYRHGTTYALLEESCTDPDAYRFRILGKESMADYMKEEAGHIAEKMTIQLGQKAGMDSKGEVIQ